MTHLRNFAQEHCGFDWIEKVSRFGTHLPILLQCVIRSAPLPILELGIGEFSTPFLHLFSNPRMVWSVDEAPEFWDVFAGRYETPYHRFRLGTIDRHIETTTFWGTVLIDHSSERRYPDLERLNNQAMYLVVHDDLGNDWRGFRFFRHFPKHMTSVFSNVQNLDDLFYKE